MRDAHGEVRGGLLVIRVAAPAILLVCAACASRTPAAPLADAGDLDRPIVIGVSQAFSGSAGALGPVARKAIDVAEAQVNAVGGVLGRTVRYKMVDDETSVAAAERVFTDFVEKDRVLAVIGPTTSGQAAELQKKLLAASRVVLVAPSAAAPPLRTNEPERERFFFRTMASHTYQARAVAELVTRKITPACTKIALVHHADVYGDPFKVDLPPAMEQRGGAVLHAVAVPSEAKASYEEEALAVARSGADCQFLVLQSQPGATYLKDFRRVTAERADLAPRDWAKFVTVGSNGMKFDSVISDARLDPANPASPSAAEGVYVSIVDTNPEKTEYHAFKNIYTAQFPLAPDETELPTQATNIYDAAILVAAAIHAAGTTTDPLKIRDALFEVSRGGTPYGPDRVSELFRGAREGRDVDYVGASGPVDFDDAGDVKGDFVIWQVQGGKFVLKERLPSRTLD